MSPSKTCEGILDTSAISFGTSGARGLVADFSAEVCSAFTTAFLSHMSRNGQVEQVYIGIDNRPSSPKIAQQCADVANAMGIKVRYFGVLPTPALAFYALQNQQPAIVVTGSHIPFDRNGLKFYSPDGEITKEDELAIVNCPETITITASNLPLTIDASAIESYQKRYTNLLSADAFKGKRIGIYEHSSAGRDSYKNILKALGADVISIGRSDEFVPIDTEAVAEEDKQRAKSWVAEFQLDTIFSTDGDGDRPLIADENGNWLRGDIVGLLTCMELGIDAIATPVSCNSAIESSGACQQVVRTRIGSPYVIAEFDGLCEKYGSVAGFEANGGFMLGSPFKYNGTDIAPLPTRDALLPFILVLARAVNKNSCMSELLCSLPSRFTASDRLKEMPTEKSKQFIEKGSRDISALVASLGLNDKVVEQNQVDGLRMVLANKDVVHLRPSGNSPELRIYVESASEEKAGQLLSLVIARLQDILA